MNNLKTGKKFLALVMALLMAFSGISVYASDLTETEPGDSGIVAYHEHIYGDWIIDAGKQPTCQSVGYRYRVCKTCGVKTPEEVMPIDLNAHKPGAEKVITPVTCTTNGVSEYTCQLCDVTYRVETAKLGHNFETDKDGNIIVETTIKPEHMYKHYSDGRGYSNCMRCGVSVEQTIFVEHDFSGATPDVKKPATCVADGYKETVCNICQYTIQEAIPKDEKAHVFSGKAQLKKDVPFNCKTDGEGIVVCELCNATDSIKISRDKAHDYVGWTLEKKLPDDAYCGSLEKVGSEVRVCETCNTEIERRIIYAPHDFTEIVDGKEISHVTGKVAATCCSIGYEVGNCVECGEDDVINYYSIDENAHNYIQKVTKAPTCTEEGEMLNVCKYDASHFYYSVIEPSDHVYDREWDIKEATCCEPGYKKNHCAVCDKDINITLEKDSNAHDFSGQEWKVTKKAKCGSTGIATASCNDCHNLVEKTLPMCYSDGAGFVRVEPTCYRTGSESYICKGCGVKYNIEIPKDTTSHTAAPGYKVRKAATCSEEGMEAKYCAFCDADIIQRVIEKTPHTVKEIIDKYPQCAEKAEDFVLGSKHHECVDCHYVSNDSISITATHNYTTWKTNAGETPNCTYPITRERVCYGCGLVEKDTNHYGDHVAVNWKFKDAKATCATGGVAVKKCTLCGEVYATKVLEPGDHAQLVYVTDKATQSETVCYGDVYKCETCGEEVVSSRAHNFILIEKGKEPTCTLPGLTESKYCAVCKMKIEQTVIPAKGHNYEYDSNGTKYCTVCAQYDVKDGIEETCNHFCHNQGTVAKVLKAICGFFWKLFKTNHFCKCGASHYHENVEVISYEYNLLGTKLKELKYSCEECGVENKTYKF